MGDNSDVESIASFEDDEPEVKPKIEKAIQLTKGGKPKRPQTEAQKLNLAKARAKGREVRREKKALNDAEKSIKKESNLIRKLEVEAKLLEHEEKKKALFIKAGYVSGKIPKERAKYGSKKVDEDALEEDEITALEAKLASLRSKKIPIKTVKVQEESDVESESEEEEAFIKPQPKKKAQVVIERSKQKKPEMEELNQKHKAPPDPMMRTKQTVDPAMLKQLQSLFPNYRP